MLRFLLILGAMGAFVASVEARTIRIELDGSGDYPTIQEGIIAAAQFDSILVGPGTYTWSNQNHDQYPNNFRGMIQFVNESEGEEEDPRSGTANDLYIIGVAGRQETIIDAERRGRVVYASGRQTGDNNVDMRFTWKGFTFQHGLAESPIVTNQWGGGAATHLSEPTFIDCRFLENEAQNAGGGVWTGGQNKATYENCVFKDNVAPYGAGLLVVNSSRYHSVWRDCRFEGNQASEIAGAIYVLNADAEFDRCIVINNYGRLKASAIATNVGRPFVMTNSFVAGNEGFDATFWGRYAVGEQPSGDPYPPKTVVQIEHTLFAFNSRIGIEFTDNVSATVSCTNSFGHPGGNWWNWAAGLGSANGNGTFDPHLCEGTNLRLRKVCELSPALAVNNPDCDSDIGRVVAGCSDCEISRELHTQVLPVYPNPFSDRATIDYSLAKPAHVRISIYDLRGRMVRTLLDRRIGEGNHLAEWDGIDDSGRSVASGVYFCEFESAVAKSRTPLLLLR